MEKNAPLTFDEAINARPNIVKLSTNSFNNVQLVRHNLFAPLVNRQVHAGSGMNQIRNNETLQKESLQEYKRLLDKFGVIPHQ